MSERHEAERAGGEAAADVELSGWRAEWQRLGGRHDLARDLSARVARDGCRIRRELLREVAASALGGGVALWLLLRSHGDAVTVTGAAGVLVFLGVWLTRLVTLREGAGHVGEGLDAFVALTRRRLTDDARWQAFQARALVVLTALIAPWSLWAFFHREVAYRAEPWRAWVGFGGVFVILLALTLHGRKKARDVAAARARFESLVGEGTLA